MTLLYLLVCFSSLGGSGLPCLQEELLDFQFVQLFFFFNIFFLTIFAYLFIYLFLFYGCFVSSSLCEGFLQLRQVGATLHCGARASRYRGLSCCGAQAPDAQAQ